LSGALGRIKVSTTSGQSGNGAGLLFQTG